MNGNSFLNSPISKKGIEQAILNLNYRNTNSPKFKLINAIKAFYDKTDNVEDITSIHADTIIVKIWGLENSTPEKVRSKLKNFNSIKSTINSDLEKLFDNDMNPEGLTIGSLNTFEMSDNAKDKLLTTFTDAAGGGSGVSLDKISEVLSIVNDFLANLNDESKDGSADDIKKVIDLVKGLSDKVPDDLDGYGLYKDDDIEEVYEDDVEDEIKEIDDTDIEEIDEDEVEDIDEDEIEEIDEDDLEEIDDTDIEEIDEDEVEDIDEDEIEEIDEDDLEEIDDTDIEEIDEDEVEDIDEDEIEEIDEDDVEEIDDTDIEEIDEGEVEDIDEDEIEEIDEDEIEEIDEDDVEEIDDTDIEEIDEDEVEEIDEDKVEEIDGDIEDVDEEELGLSVGLDEKKHEIDPNTLAEKFDGYLGAMERHYNQYLSIPEGDYTIGCSVPKKNELPIREITLPEFYVGKYPVTNALFEIFIEQTGYKTTAEKLGFGTVYYGRFKKINDEKTGYKKSVWHGAYTNKRVEGAFWYQPGGPGTTLHNKRNHPVVQVSIEDAVAFASWTGKRLPTEFEWEGAARTQQGKLFPWEENQWVENNGNFEKSSIADTTPVDYYKNGENTYGLADLLGNTLEWTSDETRPPFTKFRKNIFHIAKSCSWLSESNIKLTIRHRLEKNFTSNILSFRCVAD
jgi:formylglycine-generating enzyme required for sulfatase activity